MVHIIVAFPNMENGKNIKNILVKSGFHVSALCATGDQALHHADLLEEGLVVCAGRMTDMMCEQLREYLPDSFEMIVISAPTVWEGKSLEHAVCLTMPLKVHEFISTVEMIAYSIERKRKKRKFRRQERSEEERQAIRKAKELLMARNQMTEEEAHRYIQKTSMDSGTGLAETAQMILSMIQR